MGGSKSSLTKTGISGTSGDEKKKRKRLQNRLNQRAFSMLFDISSRLDYVANIS